MIAALIQRWDVQTGLAALERPFAADVAPAGLNGSDRKLWPRRKRAIANSRELQLVENLVNKRNWSGTRGVFASKVATYEERAVDAALGYVADRLEAALQSSTVILGIGELSLQTGREKPVQRALSFIHDVRAGASPIAEMLERESVPFLAHTAASRAGPTGGLDSTIGSRVRIVQAAADDR